MLTLRQYFPDAITIGAEINERSMKIFQSYKADEKIKFIKMNSIHIEKEGPYIR